MVDISFGQSYTAKSNGTPSVVDVATGQPTAGKEGTQSFRFTADRPFTLSILPDVSLFDGIGADMKRQVVPLAETQFNGIYLAQIYRTSTGAEIQGGPLGGASVKTMEDAILNSRYPHDGSPVFFFQAEVNDLAVGRSAATIDGSGAKATATATADFVLTVNSSPVQIGGMPTIGYPDTNDNPGRYLLTFGSPTGQRDLVWSSTWLDSVKFDATSIGGGGTTTTPPQVGEPPLDPIVPRTPSDPRDDPFNEARTVYENQANIDAAEAREAAVLFAKSLKNAISGIGLVNKTDYLYRDTLAKAASDTGNSLAKLYRQADGIELSGKFAEVAGKAATVNKVLRDIGLAYKAYETYQKMTAPGADASAELVKSAAGMSIALATGYVGKMAGLYVAGVAVTAGAPVVVGVAAVVVTGLVVSSVLDMAVKGTIKASTGIVIDAPPSGMLLAHAPVADAPGDYVSKINPAFAIGAPAPDPWWEYNPDTGAFRWLKQPDPILAGKVAAQLHIDPARSGITPVGLTINGDGYPGSKADILEGGTANDTISGGEGDDALAGGPGNDILRGGNGDDVLNGGPGNDLLDGGPGTDAATFSGKRADYTLSLDAAKRLVVTDNRTGSVNEGSDTLDGVETIAFADGKAAVASYIAAVQAKGAPLVGTGGAGGTGTAATGADVFLHTVGGGTATSIPAKTYSGPVTYLQFQFLGNDSGEIVIGTAKNDFINLLGGDDAADGGAGDDVIDGGLGSNFLTGGAGRDVFFLDGRSGGVTWGTITDWQQGEELSLWGWRPGVSKTQWVDRAGANGYQGVTMHADLDGNGTIDASVTWANMTRGQLPTPTEHDGLLWFHP